MSGHVRATAVRTPGRLYNYKIQPACIQLYRISLTYCMPACSALPPPPPCPSLSVSLSLTHSLLVSTVSLTLSLTVSTLHTPISLPISLFRAQGSTSTRNTTFIPVCAGITQHANARPTSIILWRAPASSDGFCSHCAELARWIGHPNTASHTGFPHRLPTHAR